MHAHVNISGCIVYAHVGITKCRVFIGVWRTVHFALYLLFLHKMLKIRFREQIYMWKPAILKKQRYFLPGVFYVCIFKVKDKNIYCL